MDSRWSRFEDYVVRALERAGFVQVGVGGSHCKLFHDERHLTVIVPVHR